MKKILKKIPLIIWAITLSGIAFFIVNGNYLNNFGSDKAKLLSGFLTFIGLVFVAVNIQKQWKNERIKTEYLNQPDFDLFQFDNNKKFRGVSPSLCINEKECTDDHWVDLIQVGNLSAKDIKAALFHKEEALENIKVKSRWVSRLRLAKDDEFQYKLPKFTIPFKYFDKTSNCFYLLLEYKSEYTNIKYKRVYSLCSTTIENPKQVKENDWKDRLMFYDYSLYLTIDSNSITIKQIMLNYWIKFLTWSKIKKDYCIDDWLINL